MRLPTVPDRRQTYRRWEDEPWTRGEQRDFEGEVSRHLAELAAEQSRLRRVVERGLGIVALLVFLSPLGLAIGLALAGGS